MKKTFRSLILMILAIALLAATATGALAFPSNNALDEAKELYEQEFGTPFPELSTEPQRNALSSFSRTLSAIFSIWALVIVIIVLAIVLEICTFAYARTTLRTRQLPSRSTGSRTIAAAPPAPTHCPKCGNEFGDAAFCSGCGTARQARGRFCFPIQGKMPADEFEAMVNQWLAENPYIYDCKLNLSQDHRLVYLSPRQKFYVTSASIEYSVSDRPVAARYGVAFLFKKKYIGMDAEKLLHMWQDNNTDCQILSYNGGHIHRWSNNGNSHEYYSYILYRQDIR